MVETYYHNVTFKGHTYKNVIVDRLALVVCHENQGEEAQIVELPMRRDVIFAIGDVQRSRVAIGEVN